MTVTSGADFNQGIAQVDRELIYINSVSTNTLTISADGRGFYGTTAATHASGARVTMNPVYPRVRVEAAINEAIEATYPTLYAVDTTSFMFDGVKNTYELPADCVQVLSVSATTIGPSMEQQAVRRYAVDLSAPTGLFATGNSITFHEGLYSRCTVTVTYKKAPTAIGPTDDFTVSGLRATAWKAVRLSAVSELLNYLDAQRLQVDTAMAAELSERNPVGSAARISTQLWQRSQIELEQERRRLAAETPVPINLRGR
jgi:hypothetical protein